MRIYKWNELESIIFELKLGKVAVVNTDTIMGLVSLQEHNIYQIKNRSYKKKLITFISDFSQMSDQLPEDLVRLIQVYWPGPLTIIYQKKSYRMPKYSPLLQIIKEIGPLYSSSANLSGNTPATNLEETSQQFAKVINRLIFIKGDTSQIHFLRNVPSTIFDYDQKKVLRSGAISNEEIAKHINIKSNTKIKKP